MAESNPSLPSQTTQASLNRGSSAPDRKALSSSVTKAFGIVEILAGSPDGGATLADLSTQLGMPKSTAHRYLATLVSLGLAERDSADHFRLGTRIIELAGSYLANSDLRSESRPFLDDLAAGTGETVHLAVPSGGEVVYIAKVESTHAIRMYSHIGARLPMACTALGKAILAFLPLDRRERILAQPFRARAPNTLIQPSAMAKELELVRDRGFAVDDEENEVGVCCVGAPVFDYTSDVIAAVSVSGPISRMSPARCVELGPDVRESALRISRRMGFPG